MENVIMERGITESCMTRKVYSGSGNLESGGIEYNKEMESGITKSGITESSIA